MSITPEMTSAMRSACCNTQATKSTTRAEAKPRETTRRVIAGIGMVAPLAAFIALAAWYIAL